MPKIIKDDELRAYQRRIGEEEYRKQYHRLYSEAIQCNGRYSGKEYTNSSDKLKALREKYKNGVTDKTVKDMLDKLIG